jgi:hypothetical protein
MDYNTFTTLVTFVVASSLVTGVALVYALWMRRRLISYTRNMSDITRDYVECRRKLGDTEVRLRVLEQNSHEYEQVVQEMIRTL